MNARSAALALVVLLLSVGALFFLEPGLGQPEPVDFDDTVQVGLTLDEELRLETTDEAVELPRVQVFYSQYPYVVGYYGVEPFVAAADDGQREGLFGYPIVTYVSAYDAAIDLSATGLPRGETDWISAEEAVYVTGSEARTPAGAATLPFASEDEADAFVERHGGTVKSWDAVLSESFETDDAEAVRSQVSAQHEWADNRIAAGERLLDREDEIVVGEAAETIQETTELAPANSTVVVPAGEYAEELTIDRPVTLLGVDSPTVVGTGNDTVIEVSANDTAIHGLSVTGVGGDTPGAAATDDHAHDHDHGEDTEETADWDAAIEDEYARGDAGIAVDDASNVLVSDVAIDTAASGVMLRNSPDAVVRNVSVRGHHETREAHMGVVAFRSPGVIEDSRFTAGLDGIYTHRADDIVLRDNVLNDNRMGVHLMHTSGSLIANNTVTEQTSTGIFVMTGPERNALVGNEISDTPTGIDIGGSDSYAAENALVGNDVGLRLGTTASIVEENLLANNTAGAESRTLLPTNRVVGNDFVDNGRHLGASTGPLRIWTHEGAGNYWEGAPGSADGQVLDRPYTPTDDIDSVVHRVDGSPTVAQAPAIDALTRVEGAVSGLRDGAIVDEAPLCAPAAPDRLESYGYDTTRPTCSQTTHP